MKILRSYSLLFLIISCDRGSNTKPIFINEEPPDDQSIVVKNFSVDGYSSNRLEWRLKGEKAYIHSLSHDVRIFTPILRYWNADQKLTRVYAKFGNFQEQKRTLYIKKHVRVISHTGRRLYTDHLYWDQNKKQITTRAKVRVLMPDDSVINGKGLQADINLNRIVLKETYGEYKSESN